MIQAALQDSEEPASSRQTPFLSHSRISRYLLCPEQYRLYYIENLKPKLPAASLVFGQAVHQALAVLFQSQDDPVRFFMKLWEEVNQLDVDYSPKESWEKLRVTGQRLLDKFIHEQAQRLGKVQAAERVFELNITCLDLPFVGVIDLVADLDGKKTVVDFKTAASSYEDHEVALSDQLTAYQLAEPDAEQTALCVFVKTKAPRIEWHLAERTGAQLVEFLAKVDYVAREIAARRFYKRPGRWCSWCDFLPVCLGDSQKVRETLVQIR